MTSQEALILFERIEVPEDVDRRVPEDPVEFAERTLGLGGAKRVRCRAIRDHRVVVPSCPRQEDVPCRHRVLWWLFSRRPAM